MPEYAKPLASVIDELKRLPGVGPKSAQRIAFHLLKMEDGDAERLASAIRELKQSMRLCEVCHNVTETSPCAFCADPGARLAPAVRRRRPGQHRPH
jgi:recombination protein RecR